MKRLRAGVVGGASDAHRTEARCAMAEQIKLAAVRAVAYAVMFTHAATPIAASLATATMFATLYTAPIPLVWAQDPPDPPELTFEESAQLGAQTGAETLPGPRTDGTDMFFVGEDGLETMSALELFGVSGIAPEAATLQGIAGDATAIDAFIVTEATRVRDEDSALGEGVRTTVSAARNRPHPDMSADPAFAQTDAIFDGTDPVFSTFFSGCTQVTVPTTTGSTVHVPEYEYCSRVTIPIEQCELHHDYQVSLIDFSNLGGGRRSNCGRGCIEIELGQRGEDYWSATPGQCSVFTRSFSLTVENPDAIDSVTIEEASWDDHIQVQVNGSQRVVRAGQLPRSRPGLRAGRVLARIARQEHHLALQAHRQCDGAHARGGRRGRQRVAARAHPLRPEQDRDAGRMGHHPGMHGAGARAQ